MRAKTLQIHWHAEQPVLSVDFSNDGVLATAGADKTVKLWALREDAGGRLSGEAQPVPSRSALRRSLALVQLRRPSLACPSRVTRHLPPLAPPPQRLSSQSFPATPLRSMLCASRPPAIAW